MRTRFLLLILISSRRRCFPGELAETLKALERALALDPDPDPARGARRAARGEIRTNRDEMLATLGGRAR